jgi:hypothetical protein
VPVNKALTVKPILAEPHMRGQHYCSTGPASSQAPSQIHTLVMKRPRSSEHLLAALSQGKHIGQAHRRGLVLGRLGFGRGGCPG